MNFPLNSHPYKVNKWSPFGPFLVTVSHRTKFSISDDDGCGGGGDGDDSSSGSGRSRSIYMQHDSHRTKTSYVYTMEKRVVLCDRWLWLASGRNGAAGADRFVWVAGWHVVAAVTPTKRPRIRPTERASERRFIAENCSLKPPRPSPLLSSLFSFEYSLGRNPRVPSIVSQTNVIREWLALACLLARSFAWKAY